MNHSYLDTPPLACLTKAFKTCCAVLAFRANVVKKGEDFSSEDSDLPLSQGSHQGHHNDVESEDDEFPLDTDSVAAMYVLLNPGQNISLQQSCNTVLSCSF